VTLCASSCRRRNKTTQRTAGRFDAALSRVFNASISVYARSRQPYLILCLVEPHLLVTSKKELELQLFDEFRRLSPELTLTRIEQPEPPAPDILADFQGSRIGVEITRYLREPEKQRESEEEKIIEMARQQYLATGKPTVGVSVHWVIHESRPFSDRTPVSKALASVVAQNVPPLGSSCELHFSSLPEPLAAKVNCMRIDRLVDYRASDWRVPRAGWFPGVQPDHIRRTIATKASRFDGYRKFCPSVWLLIAAEGLGPSSWCELSEKARQEVYTTCISRVFFLRTHPKNVAELTVQQHEA
jgi:hypothetical protein